MRMGKSPGKWIKNLFFGKKSSKSNISKKYASDKGKKAENGVDAPVISHPLPSTTDQASNSDSIKELSSNLHYAGITRPPDKKEENKGTTCNCQSVHAHINGEEQAALKIQATFRGYLARRAFHALWSIIKLQALYRGYLVRRQAAVTLRCLQGIIKLQAIIRGSKGAIKVDHLRTSMSCQHGYRPSNKFARKLLSSAPVSKPLQMQYPQGEPNSVLCWLERWSSTKFWKPSSLPKKPIDLKPKTQLGGYALETESGKLKRGPQKIYSSDNGCVITFSESDRIKCNHQKTNTPTAESVQEEPQSELEKVKRSLRKITSSYAEGSDNCEFECEKSKKTVKNTASPQGCGPESVLNSEDKATMDNIQLPENGIGIATAQSHCSEIWTSIEVDEQSASDAKAGEVTVMIPLNRHMGAHAVDGTCSLPKSHLLLEDRHHSSANGLLRPKGESEEAQQMGKGKASFYTKSVDLESRSQKTPTVPSYMAATESAKAKLRGHVSPRFSSDGIISNDFVRRHSLPSTINEKLGEKPDHNFTKTGKEHEIRAEWRR